MKRTLLLMMVSLMLLVCGEKSNALNVKKQSGHVKNFVEDDMSLHRTEHSRTSESKFLPTAERGQSGISRDRYL